MAIPCTYNFQGTHWSQILFLIDLHCKGMGCEMTHLTIRIFFFPIQVSRKLNQKLRTLVHLLYGPLQQYAFIRVISLQQEQTHELHVPLSNFHRNEQSPATMLHLLYAG